MTATTAAGAEPLAAGPHSPDTDDRRGTDGSAAALTVKVRYFARLREALGRPDERVALPPSVRTAGALRAHLVARGGPYAEALAPGRAVRVAVDQVMADEDAALADDAEVAFFPPVTGG